MADEHVPAPSPHSSAHFTSPSGVKPFTPSDNGAVPSDNRSSSNNKGLSSTMPDLIHLGRWLLGCLIVAVCGWGVLGLSLYLLLHYHVSHSEWFFGVLALLDLALFCWLERGFRLSRMMSLRIEPGSHAWHSAILLWLFGLLGLVFRPTHFHPQAEARAAGRAQTRSGPPQQGDNLREIVETVVFVVVWVLLLKSFAAEAFVIPTGSMAETLLGYQKEVECPDCGYKFPINCSQEVEPSDGGKTAPVLGCICPNCRQRIRFPKAPEDFLPDSLEIPDPGWNSGDRVLVAKFVYDLLNKNPDRLDVVVFKFPGDSPVKFPHSGPFRNHVPMNYIKRLIGLPGETIAISGGNLYVLDPDKGPRYDDYQKAQQDPELMAVLWRREPYMHCNDKEAVDLFTDGQFRIIRKNPEQILSMMRLVYDNDHPSKSNRMTANRWQRSGDSWTANAPHGFRHDGSDSGDLDWLRYHHVLRDNDGQPSLITDMMGYNTYLGGQHQVMLPDGNRFGPSLLNGHNWVGDLILECEAAIDNPQGELTLELSKGVDRFQARWDLSTGVCTLLRLNADGEQKLESKPTALHKKGSYRLRFANVDERLIVWVDGDLPFDNGVTYSPPKTQGPRKENDLERPASIGVRGAGVAVHKLRLFRDTYYTVGNPSPSDADVPGISFTDSGTWDGLSHPPVLTLYVQPEHFLCLGDNSPESSDGRSWGAVPRRLLLGRALLVYYPFSRAGRIR
jgi:signal peptidase I